MITTNNPPYSKCSAGIWNFDTMRFCEGNLQTKVHCYPLQKDSVTDVGFPALVGCLTSKNEAQLPGENKNSYFEVCIVFNIMLNSSLLPISTGLHVLQNDYHKKILPEALKHGVDKNEVTH